MKPTHDEAYDYAVDYAKTNDIGDIEVLGCITDTNLVHVSCIAGDIYYVIDVWYGEDDNLCSECWRITI